ncbi:hypothetical protein [Streptomyces orinoci]|uniref:Uncharacterized protein n=1 Tax=Streptomyces orinoci TaxID=67339 RepID=A0ABV3K6P7_STRON
MSADLTVEPAPAPILQLDALAKHGIPRDKVFSEKISTRVRVRPQFEAALALADHLTVHTVLRRRANGESVERIQPGLIIPTGKRKGRDAARATATWDEPARWRSWWYRRRHGGATAARSARRKTRRPCAHTASTAARATSVEIRLGMLPRPTDTGGVPASGNTWFPTPVGATTARSDPGG